MFYGVKIKNFLLYDRRTRFWMYCASCFFLIFLLFFFAFYFRPHLLKVSFYNVGQGDAIFIETPVRYQILIDGGSGPKILEEIAKDMPFYDRTIDLIISTHPDSDHIAGLIDVLERYEVMAALLPKIASDTLTYGRLLREFQDEGAVVKRAIRSEVFQKIELPGSVNFEILNPLEGKESNNDNDASVVLILRYGAIEFLFLADISARKERELLPLLSGEIEVVKIAHHGAKSSLDREFFSAISPKISVISVGKNRYGHPSREVIAELASTGSRIWRTDRDGTLTILSDGKTYWVE